MRAHVVWLRPSKQIRAPLYSIKQKRQRRWIVVKYGFVYILGFAIFGALIAIRECSSLRRRGLTCTDWLPLQRLCSASTSH